MRPVFLALEEVAEIHRRQLERYGGAEGVRDGAGLESAVAMPQAGIGGRFLHGDLHEMAAAYAFHIAQDQPYVDGNKRTGLAAALVFLALNGVLVEDPEGTLHEAMLAVSTRRLDKRGLADVFRGLAGLSPPPASRSP